jgi:hypothetical protein
MLWLGKAGAHFYQDGEMWTYSYTLLKEVDGTFMYQVTGVKGNIHIDLPPVVEEAEPLQMATMRYMQLEGWTREPGFMWIKPRGKERVRICAPLYDKLLIQMAGQFPSKARYVNLANTAKRLVLTEFTALHDEEWFVRSLNVTIALAYIEACVSQNDAQRQVDKFMPMLDGLDYGSHVKREVYSDTYLGRGMSRVSQWAVAWGLEEPFTRMESAVTPVVTNIAVRGGVSIVSNIVKLEARVAQMVGDHVMTMAGSLFPRMCETVKSNITNMVEEARTVPGIVEWLNGFPARYDVSPEVVQKQLDACVASMAGNVAVKRKEIARIKDPATRQDTMAETSFKRMYKSVVIEPNRAKIARVPYVVSEYHGLSNAPHQVMQLS